MICPKCKSNKVKVLEKRNADSEQVVRRRRECESCGFRFTTYERIEAASLVVLKKNGGKESFSSEKLKVGIERALEKRPITGMAMEKFVENIEKELKSSGEGEVESAKIGELVLSGLKDLDEVAYMRFASVYKSFDTAESFKEELEGLVKH